MLEQGKEQAKPIKGSRGDWRISGRERGLVRTHFSWKHSHVNGVYRCSCISLPYGEMLPLYREGMVKRKHGYKLGGEGERRGLGGAWNVSNGGWCDCWLGCLLPLTSPSTVSHRPTSCHRNFHQAEGTCRLGKDKIQFQIWYVRISGDFPI